MLILIVHNTIVCNIYHLAVFKYLQKDNQNQNIYLTYNIFLIYLSLWHTNNVIIYIKFSITCFLYGYSLSSYFLTFSYILLIFTYSNLLYTTTQLP